jgi:hypothetical protein
VTQVSNPNFGQISNLETSSTSAEKTSSIEHPQHNQDVQLAAGRHLEFGLAPPSSLIAMLSKSLIGRFLIPTRLTTVRPCQAVVVLSSLLLSPLAAAASNFGHRPGAFLFPQDPSRRNLSLSSESSSDSDNNNPMKFDSPAAQRNKELIWEILSSKALPNENENENDSPLRILEIAAGTGVHTEHFAKRMIEAKRPFFWYPTDPSPSSRLSIQCYIDESFLTSAVHSPMPLTLNKKGIIEPETRKTLDEQSSLDLILCINMIHISPWEATLGLLKVAGEKLNNNGCLYCYGPYKIGGTAVESNL